MSEGEESKKEKKFSQDQYNMLMRCSKKKEIIEWNRWRRANKHIEIFLEGADLQEAFLQGVILYKANLKGANLEGADLRSAQIWGSSFREANLKEADFRWSNLMETDFQCANIKEANFRKADLRRSNLKKADLNEADLQEVKLEKANLKNANLENADLRKADLQDANLQKANCKGANLLNINLTNANTQYCIFDDGITISTEQKNKNTNWNIEEFLKDFNKIGTEQINLPDNYITTLKEDFIIYLKNKVNLSTSEDSNKQDQDLPSLGHISLTGIKMNHVFICYLREDSKFVDKLTRTLEKRKIKVWLDKERIQPGVRWEYAIKNAIINGTYFIACFSENYWKNENDETYMNKELDIAIERLQKIRDDIKWFIPVKLSECDIPDIKINTHLNLTGIQWVNLYEDWKKGVKKIIEAIKNK